jgi:hypothetical protein
MTEAVSVIDGLIGAYISLADRIYSFTSKVKDTPDMTREISNER